MLVPEKIRELVHVVYASRVEEEYGELGVDRLVELAAALDEIHRHLAIEIRVGVTVCIALDEGKRLLTPSAEIPINQLAMSVGANATIQVLPDSRALVAAEAHDPLRLAKEAIVYHYDGKDCFVLDGALVEALNPSTLPSIFGTPLFLEIEDALETYATHQASRSQCSVLREEAWFDGHRLLLVNRPEQVLQKSLADYLSKTLRSVEGIETRREQIIEDKWRTDIKVTFALHKRVSYIEVKWMGQAVARDKSKISSFKPDHDDANQGALQLANYLEQSRQAAPTFEHYGILAVFDARRRSVKDVPPGNVSREDGYYFQNRDVVYSPDLAASRHDFGKPRRFFLEPHVTA